MLEFIDTNIFVYALIDFRDMSKTTIARKLLREVVTRGTGVISTQVLKEFANTALKERTWMFEQSQVIDMLEELLLFPVLVVDKRLTLAGIRRHFESQISYYDALMVESAILIGSTVLHTEDLQHRQYFGTVQVVHPF